MHASFFLPLAAHLRAFRPYYQSLNVGDAVVPARHVVDGKEYVARMHLAQELTAAQHRVELKVAVLPDDRKRNSCVTRNVNAGDGRGGLKHTTCSIVAKSPAGLEVPAVAFATIVCAESPGGVRRRRKLLNQDYAGTRVATVQSVPP